MKILKKIKDFLLTENKSAIEVRHIFEDILKAEQEMERKANENMTGTLPYIYSYSYKPQ